MPVLPTSSFTRRPFARRCAAVVAGVALGASALAVVPAQAANDPAQAADDDVTIQLLDINDFHGHIDANTVKFAGTVEQLRADAGDANTLFVAAGDNIGASVFASSTQDDEPTIDVLNALDLDVSAVGNHEFDGGFDDLTGRVADRADFGYLGANVVDPDTGAPALPAFDTFEIGGLDVAVIGAVTEETPALVTPAGIAGLAFTDPVDAVNDTVAELEASPTPPDVIIASFHEGAGMGTPDGATLDEELAAGGAFADIVENTDAEVDAIFTGHTHKQYAWDGPIPGEPDRTRPILQTGSYGQAVGRIELTVDGDSGEISAYDASTVARTATDDATLVSQFPRAEEVQTIVNEALAFADQVGSQPVAEISADITTAFAGGSRDDRSSESTLGNLVADAQLAGVAQTPAGADLSVVNPGGLRSDLLFAGTGGTDADGVVTFAEANAVLPFTNNLASVSLTGDQLKKVFEQQWQRDANGNVPSRPYLQLGTSSNVVYTFDPTRDEGDRITTLRVDGQDVDPAATYKVAIPSFLASGGDNFRAFTEGTAVDTGLLDYEVWIDYLDENSPVAPDFARHAVQVEGLQAEYNAGDEVSFSLPQLDLTSLGSPTNSSVEAFLVQGDSETSLGDFDATDGAATVNATLPTNVSGTARIRIEGAPSGTAAVLPEIDITSVGAEAKIKAATFPFIPQGSRSLVGVRLSGAEGRPSGTVTVSAGDSEIGSAELRRGAALIRTDTRGLEPGLHRLRVSYGGNDDYGPTSTEVKVYVFKRFGWGR